MNKTAIKNFAVTARVMLIEAVVQKAFEYGVTEKENNLTDSVGGRPITAEEKTQRQSLVSLIEKHGFERVMEEAAYTWFNRFIALRYMEVNGYLPSRIRVFTDDSGAFKPEILSEALNIEMDGLDKEYILELMESQDNEGLYKYLIIKQCNALNTGLPEMFEKIGGWTELLFPNFLLRPDSVIAKMISEIPEEDWLDQVQIIGWLYQYYNTEPKDKVFADLKKNIKVSAANIPAATQLFTPDWIVRYMVENSLGRLWAEGHGKPADAEWKYYLEEAEQEESVKAELDKHREEYSTIKPEQIKVLDPCMGSGHILVYAFDVLMQIYTSQGWSERDAAKSIVTKNLYGLDIDKRAYQLACFAVMMKARQYNRRILDGNTRLNMGNFADTMGADTGLLTGKVEEFAKQFEFADTYGSLMKIEFPEGGDNELVTFCGGIGLSREQLDMMINIGFILSQKYDVVCTNPPYMGGSGMNAKLSEFVKKNYPDTKSDLSTCFMEKCEKLTNNHGYYSMINIPVWMFLSSYEKLREKILHNNTYSSMVHFGRGVFGSDFGTTSLVISKKHISNYTGVYRRLFEKQGAVDSVEQKEKWFFEGMGYHTAKQENFSKIPGMPVAYWIDDQLLKCFSEFDKISDLYSPSSGTSTGDNEKYIRLWQEVDVNKVNFNQLPNSPSINKWFPCNKGGAFRRWAGGNEYLIDWENDGARIKNEPKAYLRNVSKVFTEGITWSKVGSGLASFRYFPSGYICESIGCALFGDNNLNKALAILNSKVSTYILAIINPTFGRQPGYIGSIPFRIDDKYGEIIENLVAQNLILSQTDWDSFETSWDFEGHPLV